MRKIYEYMTLEQKREALNLLKRDRSALLQEMDQDYPIIVREVLLNTLDSWNLEIELLEEEIANSRS